MFTQSCQKQEYVPSDDFTGSFERLLHLQVKSAESCKSFCNVFHERGAEKENPVFQVLYKLMER